MLYLITLDGLHYIVQADSVIAALNHRTISPKVDSARHLEVQQLDAAWLA
jgi:hypothetical protein